ncbi:hypothetical protein RND81_04G185300 [Saponaria officinalis]|uniref:Nuclear transcription factor Y subunit n=1 Tax=Saponaria officinalis TaxID=3572 RepID=A0AAW1LNG9_SAPOF
MHKSTINGQVPPFTSIPWWVSSGSQDGHVIQANINQIDWADDHQKSVDFQKSQNIVGQSSDKEKELVFQSVFSAENKNSFREISMSNHRTNSFQQFPPSQHKGYVELGDLGLSQPTVYANYALGDQCRGSFAAYGAPPMGRVMLPFSLTTEDGPIYVNPKQYHGILRRRKMRAKEGLKQKSSREKPYLHESRHRHACRRPRGVGGRFLNTKTLEDQKNNPEPKKTFTNDQLLYHSSESSASEVLQSDSLNLNSSKDVSDNKTSNPCTSEVSSLYYSKDFDCFSLNPARPFSFHPLATLEGSGQGQGSPWVTATDTCCDFFKL